MRVLAQQSIHLSIQSFFHIRNIADSGFLPILVTFQESNALFCCDGSSVIIHFPLLGIFTLHLLQ